MDKFIQPIITKKIMKNKKTIRFYCSASTKKIFSIQKFLRTDIILLKEIGYNVLLSTHWYDYLKFWTYDSSFIYFYRFGLIPAFLSKLFCKKVYFTGGIDFLNKETTPCKTYWIQCLFFKLCNIFSNTSILVSDADIVNVKKISHNKLPSNCILSYHCLDLQTYNPEFTTKEKIITTIALMERIENIQRKGVLRSIRAFAEFIKVHPEYTMYIIGKTGEGTTCVYELIKQLKLSSKIILTGSIPENEKINILKRSEYYMQLSDYEGFGIAALEALALGCKVIHSGKGGLKYIIGQWGYEIPNYNNAYDVSILMDKLTTKEINSKEVKEYLKRFSKSQRLSDFKKHIV